ncbi:capsid protein [Rhodanobacter lindaniclasticus]|uniref:Capsid protein n=2 Tax=Rhodanobacter lindaniclasticus TaxID=75310 RepID=A0A4S3KDB8_9GAMM|nr:capsid protein [Rhodanobacter lindaniclasticus]
MAQTTGTDYSSILSGLDTSTAITAIVGAGVIVAGVGFAKWATKKVARFFG